MPACLLSASCTCDCARVCTCVQYLAVGEGCKLCRRCGYPCKQPHQCGVRGATATGASLPASTASPDVPANPGPPPSAATPQQPALAPTYVQLAAEDAAVNVELIVAEAEGQPMHVLASYDIDTAEWQPYTLFPFAVRREGKLFYCLGCVLCRCRAAELRAPTASVGLALG